MADPTKTCTACGETRPVTDFSLKREKGRNPYYRGKCKPCEARYYRDRVAGKREDPAWRHHRWITNLKSKYGLTRAQYIDKMLEQDFCCELCRKPQATFYVDHDHACCDHERSCGACVRSLLCDNCNKMLGHARDDAETLKRAVAYLEVIHGSIV